MFRIESYSCQGKSVSARAIGTHAKCARITESQPVWYSISVWNFISTKIGAAVSGRIKVSWSTSAARSRHRKRRVTSRVLSGARAGGVRSWRGKLGCGQAMPKTRCGGWWGVRGVQAWRGRSTALSFVSLTRRAERVRRKRKRSRKEKERGREAVSRDLALAH